MNAIRDILKNPQVAKFFKNADKELGQDNSDNLKIAQKIVNKFILNIDALYDVDDGIDLFK